MAVATFKRIAADVSGAYEYGAMVNRSAKSDRPRRRSARIALRFAPYAPAYAPENGPSFLPKTLSATEKSMAGQSAEEMVKAILAEKEARAKPCAACGNKDAEKKRKKALGYVKDLPQGVQDNVAKSEKLQDLVNSAGDHGAKFVEGVDPNSGSDFNYVGNNLHGNVMVDPSADVNQQTIQLTQGSERATEMLTDSVPLLPYTGPSRALKAVGAELDIKVPQYR